MAGVKKSGGKGTKHAERTAGPGRATSRKATSRKATGKAATTGKAVTKGTKGSTKGTKAPKARTAPKGPAKKRQEPRAPERTVVRVRELDPYRKCGPGTSVERLIRVDEEVAGRKEAHLVYYDRHGWYCEHGRTCHAVKHARKGVSTTR